MAENLFAKLGLSKRDTKQLTCLGQWVANNREGYRYLVESKAMEAATLKAETVKGIQQIAKLILAVRKHLHPEVSARRHISGRVAHGFNRLSIGLESATRLHEVGIASNRESECRGEYVPGDHSTHGFYDHDG